MNIIYIKGYFFVKYKNQILFRQRCLKNNKIFTYLYLIFFLIKLGLINIIN